MSQYTHGIWMVHAVYRQQHGRGLLEDALKIADVIEHNVFMREAIRQRGRMVWSRAVFACASRYARMYRVRTVGEWHALIARIAERVTTRPERMGAGLRMLDYRDRSVLRWHGTSRFERPYCIATIGQLHKRWNAWVEIRKREKIAASVAKARATRALTIASQRREKEWMDTFQYRMRRDRTFALRVQHALECCERCGEHQSNGEGLGSIQVWIDKRLYGYQYACAPCRWQLVELGKAWRNASTISTQAEELRRIINDHNEHHLKGAQGTG